MDDGFCIPGCGYKSKVLPEVDPPLASEGTDHRTSAHHWDSVGGRESVEAAMKATERLRRWSLLGVLVAGAGCGSTEVQQQPGLASADPNAALAAAKDESAAPFIVPMSMVLPKKEIPPPPARTTTPPAGGQWPGAAGAPTTPGAGAAPGAATTPMTGSAPAPGAGAAGAPAMPAGMMAAAGGAAMAASTAPANNISGVPDEELEMLRDVCVAEINMYRASLTDRMLTPLTRATPEQEECSDRGAKSDGDTMSAHGAAKMGLCSSVGLGAENTCPGWPVGSGGWGGGNATIADALKGCLKAMWDEGEPPNGRDACIQDQAGCFQAHGHYLNMSSEQATAVACSFYKMSDGRSYWMNQDFAISWGGWGRQ